jgi:hypothetical protein
MPLCRSTGPLCVQALYAHTPQPDDPPPGEPDGPDVPPIGDPPPEPGQVPKSAGQPPAQPASLGWVARLLALAASFMYGLQNPRHFYRQFHAANPRL